jgi:hypothetical protein
LGEGGPFRCRIDQWQVIAHNTRQFLKGWGANLGNEKKAFKSVILYQMEALDSAVDRVGLDEEGWAHCYHLEDQLLAIIRMEEEYWRQHIKLQ